MKAIGAQHPLRRAFRWADDVAARAQAPRAQRRLEAAAPEQRHRWAERAERAPALLDGLLDQTRGQAVSGPWQQYALDLDRLIRARLPWNLLRSSILQETMLVRGRRRLRAELALIVPAGAGTPDAAPPEVRARLTEDPAGCPPPARAAAWTSPTAVHHAYHLERFARTTSTDPYAFADIVEWGGGYGGLARLLRRGSRHPPRHVVVDLPAALVLQWVWLGTVLGDDAVTVLEPGGEPPAGKIVLATAAAVPSLPMPDLFVSTWGLSETPPAAGEGATRLLSGARHLLLAVQEPDSLFPTADWPLGLAEASGAIREPIGVLAGSDYVFR